MVCLTFTWTVEYIGRAMIWHSLFYHWFVCCDVHVCTWQKSKDVFDHFPPYSFKTGSLSEPRACCPLVRLADKWAQRLLCLHPHPLHLVDKCVAVLTSLNGCFKSEHGSSFLCSKFFYPLTHLSVTLSGLSLRDLSASISLLGLEECITTPDPLVLLEVCCG